MVKLCFRINENFPPNLVKVKRSEFQPLVDLTRNDPFFFLIYFFVVAFRPGNVRFLRPFLLSHFSPHLRRAILSDICLLPLWLWPTYIHCNHIYLYLTTVQTNSSRYSRLPIEALWPPKKRCLGNSSLRLRPVVRAS